MSDKITISITTEEIKAAVLEAVGPVCQERDALRMQVEELDASNLILRTKVEHLESAVGRMASVVRGANDPDLAEALDRLHRCIVHDARDWSLHKLDALTYALVVGWDDASMAEISARHGWTIEEATEIRRLYAAIDRHKGQHRREPDPADPAGHNLGHSPTSGDS